MNLRLISCFGWREKKSREKVFGFVIDRMGVLFLVGVGRGGLLIGSDLDEFGVFLGIRKSVSRWVECGCSKGGKVGVGVCIWEVGGRFDLMVGFCFSLQSSRPETRLDYYVVSCK